MNASAIRSACLLGRITATLSENLPEHCPDCNSHRGNVVFSGSSGQLLQAAGSLTGIHVADRRQVASDQLTNAVHLS